MPRIHVINSRATSERSTSRRSAGRSGRGTPTARRRRRRPTPTRTRSSSSRSSEASWSPRTRTARRASGRAPTARRVLSHTLVPVRPRSRGKRRSLRNLLPGVRFSPPITPRFQSRHTATPFNFNRRLSTPPRRSSARIERERDGIRGGGRGAAAERVETRRRRVVAEAAEVARRRARASPVTERERDRPRG